jgi:hypothetical protein
VLNNHAKTVKFEKNGVNYYHVDFSLDGIDEGQITMLYRKADSSWHSENWYADPTLVKHIGIAIDWYENYQPDL